MEAPLHLLRKHSSAEKITEEIRGWGWSLISGNNAKERVSRFQVSTPGWHLCHWPRSFTDNNLKQCNFNFKLLNLICSLMSLIDYGSLNLVGPSTFNTSKQTNIPKKHVIKQLPWFNKYSKVILLTSIQLNTSSFLAFLFNIRVLSSSCILAEC